MFKAFDLKLEENYQGFCFWKTNELEKQDKSLSVLSASFHYYASQVQNETKNFSFFNWIFLFV